MKPLSQQPPCARAYACTTTTCAHTHLAKIADTRHATQNTRPDLTTASSYRPFLWMNNFDRRNQNLDYASRQPLGAHFGGPPSGGVRDPPSHALKNRGGNLQHADSRVLFGGNVNRDSIRFGKRV